MNREEEMSAVSGKQTRYKLFKFEKRNTDFELVADGRLQCMSIALPDKAISEINGTNNEKSMTSEEKNGKIRKILDQTDCRGYFFDHVDGMCYRFLHLEVCIGDLDTYIHEDALMEEFQWTVLPQLCSELINAVTWLHQNGINFNGKLHPRNILLKTDDNFRDKIKLLVPDKLNPFNSLDSVYARSWTVSLERNVEDAPFRKDIASIAILVYFIQSSGSHPFQVDPDNRDKYETIQKNIQQNHWEIDNTDDALDKQCFCPDRMRRPINRQIGESCENIGCKYRVWLNKLAKDFSSQLLDELFKEQNTYNNQTLGQRKDHPFFWKVSDVMNFIERSSNYLKEGSDRTRRRKFGWVRPQNTGSTNTTIGPKNRISGPPVWQIEEDILSKLKTRHPNIVNYLHETGCYNDGRFVLSKMDTIQNFYWLLIQIRNKSCHWNDGSHSQYKEQVERELENMRFVVEPRPNDQPIGEMNTLIKHCLFWMIHFPTLLLYTWKELRDAVPPLLH